MMHLHQNALYGMLWNRRAFFIVGTGILLYKVYKDSFQNDLLEIPKNKSQSSKGRQGQRERQSSKSRLLQWVTKSMFLSAVDELQHRSQQEGDSLWNTLVFSSNVDKIHIRVLEERMTTIKSTLPPQVYFALEEIINQILKHSDSHQNNSSTSSNTNQAAAAAVVESSPSKSYQVVSSMLQSTGDKVRRIADGTRDEMNDIIRRTVHRYVESALNVLAERLKQVLKDDEMPEVLKSSLDASVDSFMPDVKVEVFRKTEDYLNPSRTYEKTTRHHQVPAAALSSAAAAVVAQRNNTSLRGFLLYHMFPYDQSIWKCFRNPWWYFFTSIGMIPVIGQLWWLFLFIIKDKTNEHQLCSFIIGFKVAQFVSLGVVATVLGVLKFLYCTMHLTCDTDAPHLTYWDTIFFLFQVALVWVAFFRLPYTTRESQQGRRSNRRRPSVPQLPDLIYKDMFGNVVNLNRGGHLMKFCGYETFCFCIVLILSFCIVMSSHYNDWQKSMLLYWTRTLYGILSLPFLPFKIPLVATLLMHTQKMGYDREGRTVNSVRPSSME